MPDAPARKLSPAGFVPFPARSAATLLHLGFEHMPTAAHQLVSNHLFVLSKDPPITVIETLDDLEAPPGRHDVPADQILLELLGQVRLACRSQLVDDLVEHQVGLAHQLMEGVQVSTGTLQTLKGLRHLSR